MLLEVRSLSVRRGPLPVLHGVSLGLAAGEIHSVVGPNGAGKTTLMHAISGLIAPEAGTVHFRGEDITRLAPERRVALGIAQVPEGRWVFPEMTVEDNLSVGAFTGRGRAALAQTREHVFAMFPRLRERRRQLAGTLSGGEQQMVAIGRALMSQPELLILDEPSLGLAPVVVRDILAVLRRIREDGVSVLVVEQNVRDVLPLSDRATVLEGGMVVLEGSGAALMRDPRVEAAYLGGRAA